MAAATSLSHKYEAVTLPDQDLAGLKGEDTHRMNREDGKKIVLFFSLRQHNTNINCYVKKNF